MKGDLKRFEVIRKEGHIMIKSDMVLSKIYDKSEILLRLLPRIPHDGETITFEIKEAK